MDKRDRLDNRVGVDVMTGVPSSLTDEIVDAAVGGPLKSVTTLKAGTDPFPPAGLPTRDCTLGGNPASSLPNALSGSLISVPSLRLVLLTEFAAELGGRRDSKSKDFPEPFSPLPISSLLSAATSTPPENAPKDPPLADTLPNSALNRCGSRLYVVLGMTSVLSLEYVPDRGRARCVFSAVPGRRAEKEAHQDGSACRMSRNRQPMRTEPRMTPKMPNVKTARQCVVST